LVTIALFLANLLRPGPPLLPPGMVIVTGMFSFIGIVAVRYRSRLVTGVSNRWITLRGDSTSFLGERVLIIGSGEVAQFSLWLLRNGNLSQAFTVIGMVDDDPRKTGMLIDGCHVIGETKDISRLVVTLDIGLILYAIPEGQQEKRESIISACQSIPVRMIMIPDILDILQAFFPSDEMDKDQLFGKVLQNTTIDKLTGIYNRNQLLLLTEKERLRARRYDLPLSVLFLYVDYERPESEPNISVTPAKVLQLIVENCKRNTREVDILGHYNNNDVVIILPETDVRGAYSLAERLSSEMNNNPLQTEYGLAQVSIKMGVAGDSLDIPDADALINSAKTSLKAYQ
jgi:diguanylate cyclase (GGDEF)-like protein